MVLVNFAHPITQPQSRKIADLVGTNVQRVLDVPCTLDEQRPFPDQVCALVDSAGLSFVEWQTLPLIVNLPSLSVVAAMVLVEIHGRAGYFPSILRLRPIAGAAVRQFEVAEILNLQALRDGARHRRTQ